MFTTDAPRGRRDDAQQPDQDRQAAEGQQDPGSRECDGAERQHPTPICRGPQRADHIGLEIVEYISKSPIPDIEIVEPGQGRKILSLSRRKVVDPNAR